MNYQNNMPPGPPMNQRPNMPGPKKNNMLPWIIAGVAGAFAIGAILICVISLSKKSDNKKDADSSNTEQLASGGDGLNINTISANMQDVGPAANEAANAADAPAATTPAPKAKSSSSGLSFPGPYWYSGLSAGKYRLTLKAYKNGTTYHYHIDFRYNPGSSSFSDVTYKNDDVKHPIALHPSSSFNTYGMSFWGYENSGSYNYYGVNANWDSGNKFSGTYEYGSNLVMSLTGTLKKL